MEGALQRIIFLYWPSGVFRLQWILSGCSRPSHGQHSRSGTVHTCCQWNKWQVS